MFRPAQLLSLVLLAALPAACVDYKDPPPPCSTPACQYDKRIREGDDALREFQGDRAVAVYTEALKIAENPRNAEVRLDRCRPVYGSLLGHTQSFLSVFNKAAESLVNVASRNGLFAPETAMFPQASGSVIDLGEFIANYYIGNFRASLEGISDMASRLITDPTLNGERGPACIFEFEDGVPFRLGNNNDIEELRLRQPNAIAAELRVGKRWDAVEARAFKWMADGLTGFLYYWMAHSIEINDQQFAQLAGRITKDFIDPILVCYDGSSRYFGQPISQADENEAGSSFVDGIVNTVDECLFLTPTLDYEFTEIIRSLGWLIGDNPRTLAAAPQRWDIYMPQAPARAAAAWGSLQPIFETMVLRTARHGGEISAGDRLREYAIIFDDRGSLGVVDQGDTIGLGVGSVKLKIPASFASETTTIEQGAELLLGSLLQFQVSRDEIVTTLVSLFTKIAAQHRAVTDPTAESPRLDLSEIAPLLSATSFFGSDAPPSGVAVNWTAFYTEPVSARSLFPWWQAVPSSTWSDTMVNEFIIEEELPPGAVTDRTGRSFPWMTTRAVAGQDNAHFAAGGYVAFDPAVDTTWPTVAIPGIRIPADCLYPEDQPDDPFTSLIDSLGLLRSAQGQLYVYLQDPSLHGFLEVDTSQLGGQRFDDGCVPPGTPWETSTYEPANHYAFHRAGVAWWRWFVTNFDILELINQFL